MEVEGKPHDKDGGTNLHDRGCGCRSVWSFLFITEVFIALVLLLFQAVYLAMVPPPTLWVLLPFGMSSLLTPIWIVAVIFYKCIRSSIKRIIQIAFDSMEKTPLFVPFHRNDFSEKVQSVVVSVASAIEDALIDTLPMLCCIPAVPVIIRYMIDFSLSNFMSFIQEKGKDMIETADVIQYLVETQMLAVLSKLGLSYVALVIWICRILIFICICGFCWPYIQLPIDELVHDSL